MERLESLEVFAALRFHYESNIAVLHDVVDLEAFTPLIRSGFAKSLQLFQATPCNAYALRPHFEGELLRIPTSIPDDEMLFDRLRITDPQEVGGIWSRIMQRVYDVGGLYVLKFSPRTWGTLPTGPGNVTGVCAWTTAARLDNAHGDIAQWWNERRLFTFSVTSLGNQRWQAEVACSERATILVRHLTVEDGPVRPWHGADERVERRSFILNAATCPCIAVSQQTPQEVVTFLAEQGYAAVRSTREHMPNYAMYIDKPGGLGSALEVQTESKRTLVEQIEALEMPLLRFGCWPDGNRAALAISGDIDSITAQDFFLRIVEVF